jgi:F0F1-type ATP synthase assembly protein I
VLGILLGVGIGYLQDFLIRDRDSGGLTVLVIVICAAVGYFNGQKKAFQLRVEAQRLLVLVQIEENTRPKENV